MMQPAAPGAFQRIYGKRTLLWHHLRHGTRRGVKRLLDLTCGCAMVLLLSPVLIAAALAIWLMDGRPIFFRGSRVGQDGRLFKMLKFRSMRRDAEAIAAKIEEHKILATQGSFDRPTDAAVLKLRHTLQKLTPSDQYHRDPRILPFGGFMRRFSIDELPQLFNVLKGDMSIVGPRPHAAGAKAANSLYWEVDSRYWARHCIKPGITGLAQIRGHRGTTDAHEDLLLRLQSDLEYVTDWSVARDLRIMLATVAVLMHARAY